MPEIKAVNGTISVDRNNLGQICIHVIGNESSPEEDGLFGVQVWMTTRRTLKLMEALKREVYMLREDSGKPVEGLKGDGQHEFRDIPQSPWYRALDEDDFDSECIFCGVMVNSCYGIAGAMLPCHEEQRALRQGKEADLL